MGRATAEGNPAAGTVFSLPARVTHETMSGGRRNQTRAQYVYCSDVLNLGETVMPTIKITSFWYAIYKRLWAVGARGDAHVSTEIVSDGNFSLETTSPGNGNGIFGTTDFGKPLALGDFTAAHNPLWVILNATIPAPSPALQPPLYLVPVPPGNAMWPAMPYPGSGPYPDWIAWNAGAPPFRLIDRLQNWIENDKQIDDTPKGTHLGDGYIKAPPPAFPLKTNPKENAQILFIPSWDTDNGVRPSNAMPANFWDTSMIFVTGTDGQDENLPVFQKGTEHYIAAIIANSGNLFTGARTGGGLPTVTVNCKAFVFGTFLSPGTPLPALTNLDPADPTGDYEQFILGPLKRDVVGFRFNVDTVYAALIALMQNLDPQMFGGANADLWLKAGHACVKVWLTGGEFNGPHNNNGTDWCDGTQLPPANRKIAQRNLAAFAPTVTGMKKPHWEYFVMSQAFAGTNALVVKAAAVQADAVRYYMAVPVAVYERYVAKGGSHRGFERVTDVAKPFPEAVILRQTVAGARLEFADHRREEFFGLALGVEILKETRMSDIEMVHLGHDGRVVGGFTLRPESTRPGGKR